MSTSTTLRRRLAGILCSTLCCGALSAHGADRRELRVYDGAPLASWHVTVSGFESPEQVLEGDSLTLPKPPNSQVPSGAVGARLSGKEGARDALTLQWKDAWFASLRLDGGQPLDLRPYAGGTLEFDLNVTELAKGGITFRMGCGPGCTRKLPYVPQGRALAGKGWRHIALRLACFKRDGADFGNVDEPFALEASGRGQVAVANIRFARRGKPNVACPDYRSESVTPAPLALPWMIDWWMPRHEKKLDEIRTLREAGRSPQLVFIGDSITEGWERSGLPVWNKFYAKYDALDLGFGSDMTENVLWRLRHGEIDGIAPKVAVLLIGTNNTGYRQEDPKTTAAGTRRILDELRKRLPRTKVLLLAIFPRDEKPDSGQRKRNEQINAIVSGFADGRQVVFLDLGATLTNPDGSLSRDVMPDLLHPNEKGYGLWAAGMAPTLQKMMSE